MNDFLLDDDGDLLIINGDLVVGEDTTTDVALLMKSFKGEWKQHPLTGIEAVTMVKKRNGVARLKKEAKQQLRENGFTNIEITKDGEEINVNADLIE